MTRPSRGSSESVGVEDDASRAGCRQAEDDHQARNDERAPCGSDDHRYEGGHDDSGKAV
jgi:hypothetical protein